MGYEAERFVSTSNIEDFLCAICFGVLKDPKQIRVCEHLFCRLCVQSWMGEKSTCPVDRQRIHQSDLTEPSRFFRTQYNRLQLKCEFDECQQVVKIEHLSAHEGACSYNPLRIIEELELLTSHLTLTGASNEQKRLIDSLKLKGKIQSIEVEHAMLFVDRGLFCDREPYVDAARVISHGSTISAPHMHALILELVKSHLKPNAKVLDIGSGSGYLSVCMALLLNGTGKVVGIDHCGSLVRKSNNTLRRHFSQLHDERVEFICSEGRSGFLAQSPYDVINFGGAVDEVPQDILDQLKPNGRIVVPLNYSRGQKLYTIDKSDNRLVTQLVHGSVKFQKLMDLIS